MTSVDLCTRRSSMEISPGVLLQIVDRFFRKMNRRAYQQRSAACEVICPKPRRFRPFLHIQSSFPMEISASDAGTEVLEMILTKGSNGAKNSNTRMGSSPPRFFYGSPPCRASNPVIQDAQFNNAETATMIAASPLASPQSVRLKFGHEPAAVRIEGFRSVSAVA